MTETTHELDQRALRYAGMLGHTIAMVISDTEGRRYIAVQSCDKHRTLCEARTAYVARHPIVYERRGKKWRRCDRG